MDLQPLEPWPPPRSEQLARRGRWWHGWSLLPESGAGLQKASKVKESTQGQGPAVGEIIAGTEPRETEPQMC